MTKTFVLSVGGSLIAPRNGIDPVFLKKFKKFILSRIKAGDRFFLVIGGGITARVYQRAAGQVAAVSQADGDWLGISATRLNAQLLKTIFGSVASSEIIIDPTKKIKSPKPLVLAAGYKPGWSTDYVAVLIAQSQGIKTVINLSNIDYAYDKDPHQYPDAKKLEEVNWREFKKIVGTKWRPGLNAPFDPIASKEAAKIKMKVVILNGKNLNNLKNLLAGRKFKGTVIGA